MPEAEAMPVRYNDSLESALTEIGALLKGEYGVSKRTIGLLLLQGDHQIERQVGEQENSGYKAIQGIVSRTRSAYGQPLSYIITLRRQREVKRILSTAVTAKERASRGFAERLSRVMMNPVTGIPILLIVLYVGLYQFVGVFGAQTLVGFIEGTLFGEWVNPWVADFITRLIPIPIVQDLFVGEYGMLTLGIRCVNR